MENKGEVNILLATYNGEKYLVELMDSILSQSYPYWKLFVRDDHSSDRTPEILREYGEKDKRITIEYGTDQLGPVANFIYLTEKVMDSKYIMYCDQDDVWDISKVEYTLQTMCELENKKGTDKGLLVYCMKQEVDEDLHPIRKEKKATEDATTLWDLLAQNPIYGCTMMINRALINVGGRIPASVQMHDYYYALCAATYGEIVRIDKSLIKYRQHSGNVTGGKSNYSIKAKVKNFKRINQKIRETLLQNYRFCKSEIEKNRKEIERYICMLESGKVVRLCRAIKYRYHKPGLIQTIRLYWVLITIKRADLQ